MLNKLKYLLPFCIFCLCKSIFSQESEDIENPFLIWQPVENIKFYQLQVRDNEQEIILDEKVTETKYPLELEAGKYEHRVGLYNKFGKVYGFSEWIPFVIAKYKIPQVTSEKNNFGYKTDSIHTITIKGKYFLSKTKVFLKNASGNFPIISINRPTNNTIELVLNNQEGLVGDYDLTLENPGKKILFLEKFYTLTGLEVTTNNPPDEKEKPEEVKETKETKTEKKIPLTYPYWSSGLRSTLLPGWGQYHKEQKLKAILLDSSLLLSLIYFKFATDNFVADKSAYDTSVNQTLFMSVLVRQQSLVYFSFMQNESNFLKAEASSNQVYQASILVGAIYFINILDALFWKIPQEQTAIIPEKKLQFFTNIQNTSINRITRQTESQIEFGLKYSF